MKSFYLKYEKAIIAIFLAFSLTGIFYYLDYYNYSLYKSGYKFYVLENFIDRAIPLVPEFYWIYILYYPLCFTPIFILKDIDIYRKVALSFFLEFLIAFLIFLIIPVRMIQPEITGTSISEIALKKLYNFDPGFNVFPSLHVANMVLITFIFYDFSKFWGRVFLGLTILISVSILFVKQHYFWDIPSGVLLGWVVYYIVFEKDIIKNFILRESKT
jgi:membrane-associated phospholipid phosphatase